MAVGSFRWLSTGQAISFDPNADVPHSHLTIIRVN
jgi:hypothetical protein